MYLVRAVAWAITVSVGFFLLLTAEWVVRAADSLGRGSDEEGLGWVADSAGGLRRWLRRKPEARASGWAASTFSLARSLALTSPRPDLLRLSPRQGPLRRPRDRPHRDQSPALHHDPEVLRLPSPLRRLPGLRAEVLHPRGRREERALRAVRE